MPVQTSREPFINHFEIWTSGVWISSLGYIYLGYGLYSLQHFNLLNPLSINKNKRLWEELKKNCKIIDIGLFSVRPPYPKEIVR